MRIVISGINGFIGKDVSMKLAENAEDMIFGIGRKEKTTSLCDKYCQADITTENGVSDITIAFSNADVFIHLAANLSQTIETIRENIIGTYNMLRVAKQLGCKIFINISSSYIADISLGLPITEGTKNNPKTLYHISKYAAEQVVMSENNQIMKCVSLRIPAPIGINMPQKRFLTNVIAKCLTGETIAIYGRGTRIQNYIDTRDIAQAIKKIIISRNVTGLYIIGGYSYSNNEVAELCKQITSSPSKIQHVSTPDPEDNSKWIIDYSKAKRAFGYTPQFTLEDTIRDILSDIKRL